MKGYEKLYIREITDLVALGMENEVCRMYLDFQNMIGKIGLLMAFVFY